MGRAKFVGFVVAHQISVISSPEPKAPGKLIV